MNIVISFAGLDDRGWFNNNRRPFALQQLAGGTVLGHILTHVHDAPAASRLIVICDKPCHSSDRLQAEYPDISLNLLAGEGRTNVIAAVRDHQEVLDGRQTLLIAGNYISEIDYRELDSGGSDVVFLVQTGQDDVPALEFSVDHAGFAAAYSASHMARWAGACWFRSGSLLKNALLVMDGGDSVSVTTLLSNLQQQGVPVATREVQYCVGTNSPREMLNANERLLGLGYGMSQVIERSYAEDFTVLPPVFLHDTAVIENAVIGPFANIEAGALIRNSVVRSSLIGKHAQIENMILDSSIIGDDAIIGGRMKSVIVGDGEKLENSKEKL